MSAEDERAIFQQARDGDGTADAETDAEPLDPSEGDEYTLAHDWTLTANTSDADETVATIRDGPAVRVTGVTAKIEADAGANVRFHVRSGDRQIAPEVGDFVTGDDTFPAEARATLSPDDELTARWTNTSSTARFAVVYVHVEVL